MNMKDRQSRSTKDLHGKLIKGRLGLDYITTKHLSKKEKKEAFGSRVSRFKNVYNISPVSGPGTYGETKDLFIWKHKSLSTKGYGPMLSKQQRFNKVHYVSMGPGKYERPVYDKSDMNCIYQRCTRVGFNSTTNRGDILNNFIRQNEKLGPGCYDYNVDYNGNEKSWKSSGLCSSAFKTTGHKTLEAKKHQGPSPNDYITLRQWEKSEDPSSTFKKSLGHGSSKPIRMTKDGGLLRERQREREREESSKNPGPGSYNITSFSLIKPGINNKNKFLSMFYLPPSPKESKKDDYSSPGPGEYEYDYTSNFRGDNKLSSFQSKVPKLGYIGCSNFNLPGPAYYDNNCSQLKSKKTFHINAKKIFMK